MKPSSYPNDAQVVFEWYRFNVYERKKTESDNNHYTYHRIHRKDSVSIIATQWNQILLPRFTWSYKWDYLGIFGWIVDERDGDFQQKAQEELLEEAGMESKERSHWKSFQYHGFEWQVHFMIAKNCQITSPQNLAPAEWTVEIVTISFDDFLTMAINNQIKWIPYCLVELCKIYYDPIVREDFRKRLFD